MKEGRGKGVYHFSYRWVFLEIKECFALGSWQVSEAPCKDSDGFFIIFCARDVRHIVEVLEVRGPEACDMTFKGRHVSTWECEYWCKVNGVERH